MTTAPKSDVTEVRFGTRSMLIVTAFVAVASTTLGAFIRKFPADARPRLLVYWGILAALMVVAISFNAWRRRVAERSAGPVRFQLAPHSYFLPKAPRIMALIIGMCMLLLAPATWVMGSFVIAESNRAVWLQTVNWWTFYAIVCSGLGVTYFWWHRQVRFCEKGLIVRNEFLHWEDCRRWYWDACTRGVIVIEWFRHGRVAAHVPPEQRAAIESLLREKTAD